GPMMFRGPGGRGQTEEQDGGQATVTAAADTQTNSVVVAGPENLLNVVEDVIKTLDRRDSEAADVRVFQLRYADAMNTAQMINDLFGDDAQSSGSQGGMNFMRGGPGGMFGGGRGGQGNQQQETSSILTVSAAADSRTNSVVVTGPAETLDVVADMIKNVDTQLATLADVKVYHLEYADAQDTAELINEVFGESSSSSRTTSSSGQQNQAISFRGGGFGGRGGQQQTTGTAGNIADVPIIASADSRTNSVVVSGPEETLAIITDVVKELDENPEQERQIFLYPLKNANAENLMTILNNLFLEMAALNDQAAGTTGQQFQGNQRTAQPAGGGAAGDSSDSGDDLSEDTYFEADVDTNTLLVLTSSKNYEKIKPILDDLDKPIGQVLIKVLFAEVTHTDSVDLGTEFSMLNISNGDSVQTSQVFGTPPTLSYQNAGSFPTGLAVRTVEGDLDLTIHALQESGRLNVLSRPYILASNNQLATITVGEEVAIPTGTTEVAGQSQTVIEYRDDIGIVLNVTPSINPEGLVNMIVNPQITTRSSDSVQITEDLAAETFNTRSAETKVAVRNGQTIVIGGLIEDQLVDTIRKVPLLGDIPLAGHLFKRTVKEKAKTELLIFLTPHVAMDPTGLTPISDAEQDRSILNTDKTAAEIFRRHMEAMDAVEADPNKPE
ncbi:MAG: secretin N-terminal domain-containing protein, partial [Planctomycetota bacterium]